MRVLALTQSKKIQVGRSRLRQNQSAILEKAGGRTVVVITGRDRDDKKCVVDMKYFEEILRRLRAAMETLEIATDAKLVNQILRAAETLDNDVRLGKLHSIEDAFGERRS